MTKENSKMPDFVEVEGIFMYPEVRKPRPAIYQGKPQKTADGREYALYKVDVLVNKAEYDRLKNLGVKGNRDPERVERLVNALAEAKKVTPKISLGDHDYAFVTIKRKYFAEKPSKIHVTDMNNVALDEETLIGNGSFGKARAIINTDAEQTKYGFPLYLTQLLIKKLVRYEQPEVQTYIKQGTPEFEVVGEEAEAAPKKSTKKASKVVSNEPFIEDSLDDLFDGEAA